MMVILARKGAPCPLMKHTRGYLISRDDLTRCRMGLVRTLRKSLGFNGASTALQQAIELECVQRGQRDPTAVPVRSPGQGHRVMTDWTEGHPFVVTRAHPYMIPGIPWDDYWAGSSERVAHRELILEQIFAA